MEKSGDTESGRVESPKASQYRIVPERRIAIRPLSARAKKSPKDGGSDVPQLDLERPRRPWTAHPKTRSDMSANRVARPAHLRKSHMRPPVRTTLPETTEEGKLSVMGLDTQAMLGFTPQTYQLPTASTDLGQGVRTLVSDDQKPKTPKEGWAVTKVADSNRDSTPERSKKRHPSFETWVSGSPHDSDEYDTDLETDLLKNLEIVEGQDKKKKMRIKRRRSPEEEYPADPTGKSVYQDQCQRQGVVPVSFLFRHLGDRNLRMRHHYLGGEGTKPVAAALQFNTVTEALDLGDNYLQAEGAMYLARMMRDNTFIVYLDISNNFIKSSGAEAIAEMLEVNTTLKTICLAGNQLIDKDAYLFIDALRSNISLTSLDFSNNNFGEMAGVYIGGALAINDSLHDLDLSWNAIRGKGAVAVAEALYKNNTLEVLDLAWNGFGVAGAAALQQALRVNTKLKVLDLSNNRLNKEAAKHLCGGISQNFGLETLLLNLNPLADDGIELILQGLAKQESLRYVSLEEMNVNPTNYKTIKEMEAARDISILHGGMGGYQRYSSQASVLRVLSQFLREHRSQLTEACTLQDKDKSGILSTDELKVAFREAGLRLTNKQMSLLIDDIDSRHTGSVPYGDILSGKALGDFYDRKPSVNATVATTYSSRPGSGHSSFGQHVTVA
ncbi:leucine-rich repeat-containing protein 74A-like isoform X2 [Mizuhopecten yessoensis]|uniref:leucine-rich repeat-containing protein 74A-like isoform X2 n=1 Tax=Mizuhopecten yessoensis TaxID=6573 RepID=UPI000B4591F0|nr:leucine-rich repeat-containing protein 74A-like isoform X2 [Mizuhopecten yessoensis]